MEGGWTSDSWAAWANLANLTAAVEEMAALLSVSATNISASGLCLTSSWTSCAEAIHQSSRSDPLMRGSAALPELMAATVAQISQNTRTVVPDRAGSQSLAATRRFQLSRLEMENPKA